LLQYSLALRDIRRQGNISAQRNQAKIDNNFHKSSSHKYFQATILSLFRKMENAVTTSIVFTFIAKDKPGLVERLSKTVSDFGGNWLESRMSHLAGQFAGITRIQVSTEQATALRDALLALSSNELTVVVQPGESASPVEKAQQRSVHIIGNDRPGIVLEVSRALAARSINVSEMNTNITSAPMTAESLFESTVIIVLPDQQDLDELVEKLDEIANDLAIDINLD
jgi:glycine cleavage system regulatory protein